MVGGSAQSGPPSGHPIVVGNHAARMLVVHDGLRVNVSNAGIRRPCAHPMTNIINIDHAAKSVTSGPHPGME